MSYTIHTEATAPDAAKPILAGAQKAYGFVPNLLGVMAAAPALVKGYGTLSRIFEESSFSAVERQVVLLTASAENECGYCMAAHSAIAGMQKVPDDVIRAIRTGQPIGDKKLEALRRFTAAMVSTSGRPTQSDVKAFVEEGYTEVQMLEVVLGVGVKTLSNYTNHIAHTPVDAAFQALSWSKAE